MDLALNTEVRLDDPIFLKANASPDPLFQP
jgi:hypothetical protein